MAVTSILKEISPPFIVTPPFSATPLSLGGDPPYSGQFAITSANVGMMPQSIHKFQQIPKHVFGWINYLGGQTPKGSMGLTSAAERCDGIFDRFFPQRDMMPVICLQEVFDPKTAQNLVDLFKKCGYTVIRPIDNFSSLVNSGSFVNSGLFLATRYPLKDQSKLRFYEYLNLTHDDKFSHKGLLRVPLSIPLGEGTVTVIIYVTHLQAQIAYKKERREQLEGILSVIQSDQENHPDSRIFLLGDLNISDTDEGKDHFEYQENAWFFDCFHDFIHLVYGSDGIRKTSSSTWSMWDRQQGFVRSQEEPTGTFYAQTPTDSGMTNFQTQTEKGCIYDRILLYKVGKNPPEVFDAVIRRMFDGEKIKGAFSDHLPVTVTFDFEKFLSQK